MKVSKKVIKSTKRCFTSLLFKPSKKIESQLNKDLLKILNKGGTLNQAIHKAAKNPNLVSPTVRKYMKNKMSKMQRCVDKVLKR